MRESIAFHAHGITPAAFELSLAEAVELASDEGYSVVGISHAASLSTNAEGDYNAVLWSAVVWGQREEVAE